MVSEGAKLSKGVRLNVAPNPKYLMFALASFKVQQDVFHRACINEYIPYSS
jgi:hypothetical protein